MHSPQDALRAGLSAAVRPELLRRPQVVVIGGAGPLGGAVLEQVLGSGRFARVTALVSQPVEVALNGLHALVVPEPALGWRHAPAFVPAPDIAILVFDREGSRHGREAAFVRPEPAQLLAIAQWLLAAGVRRLLMVLPHAPALLPQALKAGLATLDEQGVAALGFEQLVLVRPARQGASQGPSLPGRLHALARGLLAQLHWMVPQRDQPLRPRQVGRFVVQLALALEGASPGTRVAPPELLWDWAQPAGGDALLHHWLATGHWTPPAQANRRW